MAGRPKKMAAKVAKLERQAATLFVDANDARPQQYVLRPDDDPLCRAWNTAVKAALQASTDLEYLGDMLRAKAGIVEPGPSSVLSELADEEEQAAQTA